MRVLFIGFVWPEPNSSAAGQNIMSYVLSCVQQNWQVSFCSAAESTQHCAKLSELGVDSFAIALNCTSFNEKVAKLQPDIVVFDRFLSFEQFAWRVKQACPNALQVLDAEDLHFLRQGRQNLLKQLPATTFQNANDILKQSNSEYLYNALAMRELACIYQADITLVLSAFEEKLLVEKFNLPRHQVKRLPFILSKQVTGLHKSLNFEQKQDFIFIGNFRHAPNYHAVKVLREQLWPSIHKRLLKQGVSAQCHVYGAYLSPKAKQLENKKLGFLVHGFAQNQFDVISKSRIMLAPITFGAGVKGKLLDAMRCKTATITTEIGAEGITERDWPNTLAQNHEQFVQQAVLLYTHEQQWQNAIDKAAAILEHGYNIMQNQSNFVSAIETAFTDCSSNRKNNFLQQLLSQQQFQSHRYMSQWIEAKNKPAS